MQTLFILALATQLLADPYEFHMPEPEPPPVVVTAPIKAPLVDLEADPTDFILETRQIEIPGYAGAFNPTMTRWKGMTLFMFRIRDPQTNSTSGIGITLLDENFTPTTSVQFIRIPFNNPLHPTEQQDPRLIPIGDRLFMVYSNILEHYIQKKIRRVYVVEIFYENGMFIPGESICLSQFEGESDEKWEKNWVPFEFQGDLLLAYSIFPHKILWPLLPRGECETVCQTRGEVKWDWGPIRGGTQAFPVSDTEYLSIFHSSTHLFSVHSEGKKISHYFMGGYTFEKNPPFRITRVSPKPLIAKGFYNSPPYKTWKPLRAIFPCGLIIDDDYIWISYGRQDYEMWIAKCDKKRLLRSLIPVSPATE